VEEGMKRRLRSSYLAVRPTIELSKKPIIVWGYDPAGKFVCRLEINSAGIAVYAGEKGGKKLRNVTWERLVQDLSDET
jgi:hypothetical protein